MTKPLHEKLLTQKGWQFRTILKDVPPFQIPAVLEHSGIAELLALIPKEEGPTLEDATLDDIERLKKLSVKAMEAGMNPLNPNAQMVRAFHAFLEAREGEKQLDGLIINVVPSTVPDHMHPMLMEKMEELTEIANRPN